MNWIDLLRAVFGLAITLGLIGMAAYVVRRYAPDLMAKLQGSAPRRDRRLKVIETLMLDPSRRLVLVKVDQEERLLLLGEGRELIEPRGPVDPPVPAATAGDAATGRLDDALSGMKSPYSRARALGDQL
ncbi:MULTISPECIES: flagellar biosynthetic protein FliO [unclassified Brevundimonas]|uniref:flagellar biosynthetic protein FliO n=1 Tax=unclassified Brevundimonas TaxID=2622653 RepID=UPI0025BECDCB|nr:MULTISPECIES: flagellar biosynthetic protein FliO [unclassified Brevundimonas]